MRDLITHIVGEGGGGTPIYGLYRYVQPQRVWFSAILVINRVSILADFDNFCHN